MCITLTDVRALHINTTAILVIGNFAENHFGMGLLGPDDSAYFFNPGTPRSDLVGPLGNFLFFSNYCFILFMCIKTENDINFQTMI